MQGLEKCCARDQPFPAAGRPVTATPGQAQAGFLGMRDYVDRCPRHLSCSTGDPYSWLRPFGTISPSQVSLTWKSCLADQQSH